MEINTINDAEQFCRKVRANKGLGFRLVVRDNLTTAEVAEVSTVNDEARESIIIPKASVLQKGIEEVYHTHDTAVIVETPTLVASRESLVKHKDLTGPTVSIVANCYDPESKRVLLQVSGTRARAPHTLQNVGSIDGTSLEYLQDPNASRFREHLSVTARKALENVGILHAEGLVGENPIGVYACPQKVGRKTLPHLVFGFGFAADLSSFPELDSAREVKAYMRQIKGGKAPKKQDCYCFTTWVTESIAQDMGQRAVSGPVYESLKDFSAFIRSSESRR